MSRIALVHRGAPPALAEGLRGLGHEVTLIAAPAPVRLAESVLAGRGFTPGLTQLPPVAWALRRLDADVVHAFAADLAAVALRVGRAPVVLTLDTPLDRATTSNRRLRLRLLSAGVEGAGAIVVPTDAGAAALRRWMALDAVVLEAGDAAGHAELYGSRSRMRRAGTPA